jgi:hypothetical protein
LDGLFHGAIDKVSSTGYVEGWVASKKHYFEAVAFCVVCDGKPIGTGIANRFRADLLSRRIGHAWHGFRVRINGLQDPPKLLTLSLVELKTLSLISAVQLSCPKAFRVSRLDVDELLSDANLEVEEISSLKLAEPTFDDFIRRNGVEEFVDCAYCYVLGRPADPSGREHYAKLISSREITPLAFLAALFDSDERRDSRWPVLAPSDPGFFFAPQLTG